MTVGAVNDPWWMFISSSGADTVAGSNSQRTGRDPNHTKREKGFGMMALDC